MSTWSSYWKIVTPASRKNSYSQPPTINMDDGMNLNSAGYAAFATTNWYSNLLKGATARLQRYKQYEAMDTGDISRALDIIAEEISNPDKRTGLPFIIDYQTEENQDIPDTTVTTIRAALRHWSNFHKLSKRVYNVARHMVKYGDCFFRKTSDTKIWEFVDATRVIGIEIDPDGNKIAYHIRPSSFQNSVRGAAPMSNDSVEITPAVAMLHFTLCDDMSDTAPFGLSVLQSAFKDYQKLVMLEDAAIIYRLVRAPERRVFYIDTGNMPPQRIKQHLETIRNDMRQKRQPNTANANQTDSSFNPESMMEDFFMATNGAGRGSKVETLPSGTTWEIPELDYFLNKVFRAIRVPTSYMKGQDSTVPGSTVNDGKVGVAYMEERIFANYVMRLQAQIQEVFDEQFKTYLKVTGINIDSELFKLKLAEPQNFALYRQAALDTDLIAAFKSIEDTPFMSKRFMMKRYLGLTEDDIQINEALLAQERKIEDVLAVDKIQQTYDPQVYENREKVQVEQPPAPEAVATTPEEPPAGTPPAAPV